MSIKTSLASLIFFVLSVQAFGQLVHPGISHKRSDLDRMKAMVEAGEEPWLSTFNSLRSHGRAQHDYQVNVVNQDPSFVIEYSDASDAWFINDGTAAYYNALMWYITEDVRHAEKAIEIFNTYKGLRRNSTGIPLRSGRIWRIIEAAEIIAHTYDGWDPDDMQDFKNMLVFPGYSSTTVPQQAINSDNYTFYWHIYNGDPVRHGNQGLFAMRTMMAMGIFLDNEVMYERALRYLRGQTHRADDLSYPSGPPINNNEITECDFFDEFTNNGLRSTIPDYGYNEVIDNYIFPNGQNQESSRDQAHGMAGVITINNMCEMAWNQGDDLYGHLDNRPLLGLEFYLRYNLSFDISHPDQPLPWEPTVESGEYVVRRDRSGRWRARIINPGVNCDPTAFTRGIDNLSPVYELTLSHYRDRLNLPSDDYKWLQRGQDYRTQVRGPVETEGVVTDHPVYGSLTFRRVSPGDPVSGFDNNGLPQFAMNELPMLIEAENFDYFSANGQNRSYADSTPGNQGGVYRFDADVDVNTLQSTGGGHYVGDTTIGEFLTYTISVPEEGTYDIQARAASDSDSFVRVSVNSFDRTGVVAIPDTGSLANFTTFTVAEDVLLSQGVHQLKVEFFGAMNLDYLVIGDIAVPTILNVATGNSSTAPTVSSSDLAQTAYLSSSAVSSQELGNEHPQLFNGQIGNEDGDSGDIGEVRLVAGDSLTINFDTSVNTEGYDITQIDSIFGWNTAADGRSNQGYSIRFDLVDGSSVTEPGQHWNPNDPAFFWTTVSFAEAGGGLIASGVESITFQITEPANAGSVGGVLIAREFDIFGTPSGNPSGGFILGDCNLDGFVNFLDIAPFIELLTSGVFLDQADCDQNGFVNFLDIAPFIAILSGT